MTMMDMILGSGMKMLGRQCTLCGPFLLNITEVLQDSKGV